MAKFQLMYCIFKNRRKVTRKKENKAQVTFYAILGLFLFMFLIIGVFYYNNVKEQRAREEAAKIQEINLNAQEIERLVSDCIRKESFDGLKILGRAAGYFEIPMLIDYKGTAMWQFDQANIQPFLNQTQERLIEYVDKNVPKCFENANVTQYGFLIEKKEPKTFMEFGASDVTIKVIYPIKVSKGQFTKEFSEFFNTFNIRYRAIYEAATEVNERLFDADFDIKNPLKKLDYLKGMDFDISYKMLQEDIITFTVTDKRSITPENQNYMFSFAAKLGNSTLKKLTTLQNRSATNPAVLPYTIYSVDKKAQLDIFAGTTVNLDGKDAEYISVQQAYPNNLTTKDIPQHKKNDQIVRRGDDSYVIDNPVYNFEPTGIRFNKPEKLTIYYEDEAKAGKGVGILMGKKDAKKKGSGEGKKYGYEDFFWVPIPSSHDIQNKRVIANILGFTSFTAVNCASQQLKDKIGEHFFEPETTCYVSLAIMILAILLVVVTFGAGLAVAALGATAAPGSALAVGAGALSSGYMAAGASAIGTAIGVGAGVVTGVVAAVSVISTGMSVIGSTTDAYWGTSGDNCVTFYPLCDQNVEIVMEKSTDEAEGQCVPEKGQRVAAGTASMVCAQVEGCGNFLDKTLCKSCSIKCTAKVY
ncbi:hypothetical protein HYY70_03245 [Candidatus Woesearchaeota archaeon]|nr:hypothetical protein [Candidatus Woesearchaeota archaeon]